MAWVQAGSGCAFLYWSFERRQIQGHVFPWSTSNLQKEMEGKKILLRETKIFNKGIERIWFLDGNQRTVRIQGMTERSEKSAIMFVWRVQPEPLILTTRRQWLRGRCGDYRIVAMGQRTWIFHSCMIQRRIRWMVSVTEGKRIDSDRTEKALAQQGSVCVFQVSW